MKLAQRAMRQLSALSALSALVLLVCQAAMASSSVHVSVGDDDRNLGTPEDPVATVRKALELVRR